MMAWHLHYYENGPLDQFFDSLEADERRNCLHRLVTELKVSRIRIADIAVKVVKTWARFQGYILEIPDEYGIRIVAGVEAVKCESYLHGEYWDDVFKEEIFWNNLCTGRTYNAINIEDIIPADRYQRMVYHHLYRWRDHLKPLLCDKNISEENRVSLLKKQLENIAFMLRRRAEGSYWQMISKPDKFLLQTFTESGSEVPVLDETGAQLRDIMGKRLYATKTVNISKESAEGPKPDYLDKRLYKEITEYANKKLEEQKQPLPRSWTMVRSYFKAADGTHIRCYAFSGSSKSNKLQHDLPVKWWKQNKGYWFEENREIYLCNIEQNQFGQNMILAILNALRPFIAEDLKQLTEHLSKDDHSSAQSLIKENRSDLFTLDYGEYYDTAVNILKRYDNNMINALKGVLVKKANADEIIKKLWKMVSVGSKNLKFEPNKEALDTVEELNEVDKKRITVISDNQLAKLKKDLDKLPTDFLDKLKSRLEICHCGEDNVLSCLLSKYLDIVNTFEMSPVWFVALDGKNIDGKPFCEVCDRKVRFYSVLPSFMYELGFSSKDMKSIAFIEEISNLLFKAL